MATTPLKAQSSLSLRHNLPYYQQLPEGADVFEACPEHLILANSAGHDILFWIAPYILDGKTKTGILARDAAAINTMLLIVPERMRGQMNDTDFIDQGFNPGDYLPRDELRIEQTNDTVTYRIRNAEFVCSPPNWKLRGEHEGVEFDLVAFGTAPTHFYIGDFDDLGNVAGERQAADYGQFTAHRGSITVRGKVFKIEEGYGTHHHPVSAMSYVQSCRTPFHWSNAGNRTFQCFFFTWAHEAYARLRVEDEYLMFDPKDINVHILEWWRDPRSLATVPCKWHISLRSERGIFDVHAAASGRINRILPLRDGYVLDIWFVGTMNGVFFYPDGRTRPVDDMLFQLEWAKTIAP